MNLCIKKLELSTVQIKYIQLSQHLTVFGTTFRKLYIFSMDRNYECLPSPVLEPIPSRRHLFSTWIGQATILGVFPSDSRSGRYKM